MKSNQIRELQAKIAVFTQQAIHNPTNQHDTFTLNKISKSEADIIKAKTGFNLNGYYRVLDNFNIIHILHSHGDKAKEAGRGQIEVLPEDFELIPIIVESENITYRGKNRQGRDVILYEAEIGNKIFYAEEIRTRQKQLVLNSMWKRKKKPGKFYSK